MCFASNVRCQHISEGGGRKGVFSCLLFQSPISSTKCAIINGIPLIGQAYITACYGCDTIFVKYKQQTMPYVSFINYYVSMFQVLSIFMVLYPTILVKRKHLQLQFNRKSQTPEMGRNFSYTEYFLSIYFRFYEEVYCFH